MEKGKRGKSSTPEQRRVADALQKLMRRYTRGEDLTVEELQLLDKAVMPDDTVGFGDEAEIAESGKKILAHVYTKTAAKERKKELPFRKGRNISRIYQYGIAATFLLLIGMGTWMKYQFADHPKNIELVSAHDVEKFMLPDGSTVYLNRESKLVYDEKSFDKNLREIHLTGEAFFEVKKNPEKPFIVYGGETMTTVRGTSFNVKAYPGVRKNVISVRDGYVEVTNVESGLLAVLTHNRQVTWDTETHTVRQDSIDWQSAAGWKEGKLLVFNSADIDEIKLKIEQYYGIWVETGQVSSSHINFYGSYPADDGGVTLLQELNDIYGIRSKRHDNKIELYK